jgi:glycosyltransferase involved in cell wall biosynthesis
LTLKFSIIIPVYNRPDEIDELLQSLLQQTYSDIFEVVIVEDGSKEKCDRIVESYKQNLQIKYLSKPNTGAGLSRNFGMKNASGNYFIILDSDVLLPPTYLEVVANKLIRNYTDAYGGPDAAHQSFSKLQKAINYSMTSLLTTGGLRGNKKAKAKFQPRSFNMGISKKAFQITNGFGVRKTGEDIDLSFRLWEKGFDTQLISDAFVYHKRRTSLSQFFRQTYLFGKERPVLNRQYPNTAKFSYWFPSLFLIGIAISIIGVVFNLYFPFVLFCFYMIAIFVDASLKNHNLQIGFLSIISTIVQFSGYGLGFIKAIFLNKKSK